MVAKHHCQRRQQDKLIHKALTIIGQSQRGTGSHCKNWSQSYKIHPTHSTSRCCDNRVHSSSGLFNLNVIRNASGTHSCFFLGNCTMILLSVPYLIAAVLNLSAHIIYLCNLHFSLAQSQHLTIHHWNGIIKLVLFSLNLFYTKWACGTFTFTLAMLFICYGLHYFHSLFCCYNTIIVLVTFKLICSVFIQPEMISLLKHAAHVPACHNIQECVFFSEKEMPSSCRSLNTCNVNFGSRGQGKLKGTLQKTAQLSPLQSNSIFQKLTCGMWLALQGLKRHVPLLHVFFSFLFWDKVSFAARRTYNSG